MGACKRDCKLQACRLGLRQLICITYHLVIRLQTESREQIYMYCILG